MIDYVSTEIVSPLAYIPENTPSAFYPYIIDNSWNGVGFATFSGAQAIYNDTLWLSSGELWFSSISTSVINQVLVRYQNEPWYPYIAKTPLSPNPTAFTAVMKELNSKNGSLVAPFNGSYSRDEGLSTFGLTAYILVDYGRYLEGVPVDGSGPGSGNYKYFQLYNFSNSVPDISGSPIEFLYNFGESLVSTSDSLYDILSFSIGGFSLLSLTFGAGFLIFAGWVIFKWIIPI